MTKNSVTVSLAMQPPLGGAGVLFFPYYFWLTSFLVSFLSVDFGVKTYKKLGNIMLYMEKRDVRKGKGHAFLYKYAKS